MIPARKHGLVFKPKDLKVGDLLFFKGERGHYTKEFPQGIGHVEMYLGNGKLIEACGHSRENNRGVRLINLKKELKRQDFCLIKRVLKN
jgi:cell wall-associated NlpC family hydrolase